MNSSRLNSSEISYWYNPVGLRRTYGVVLKFGDEKLKINYKFEVFCLKKDAENNFYFKLNKGLVFVNGKRPSLLFDEIAEKCADVIYPLELKVSPYGEIKKITNHSEIKHRWSIKRKILTKAYSGEEVELFFNRMEDSVCSVDVLNTVLKKDWFLVLFFSPIHSGYGLPALKADLELGIVPYKKGVKYTVEQFVTKSLVNANHLIYHQKGSCTDDRTENDILKGNIISTSNEVSEVKGDVSFTYEIFENSPVFDRIMGSCNITFASGLSKEINVEIHDLRNEIPKTDSEIELEKTKQPKPKKRFSLW